MPSQRHNVPRGRRDEDRLANQHADLLADMREDIDHLLGWKAGLEGERAAEVELTATAQRRRAERQAMIDRWFARATGIVGLAVAAVALVLR